jgi:hypothetical protein
MAAFWGWLWVFVGLALSKIPEPNWIGFSQSHLDFG